MCVCVCVGEKCSEEKEDEDFGALTRHAVYLSMQKRVIKECHVGREMLGENTWNGCSWS